MTTEDRCPLLEGEEGGGDLKLGDPRDDEEQNIVDNPESVESVNEVEFQIYTRRWYILLLFCLLACHQCLVWNTFGPIESGAIFAYSWSDSTIPMFANWGTIMFIITVVPLTKLVEYDIRTTVLLVTGLMTLGTIFRCSRLITKNHMVFLASCHICSILNGISGVTIMAAPPLISSHWFPPGERTTATSINQAGNMMGNGMAMLVGPALVNYTPANKTSPPSLPFILQPGFSNPVFRVSSLGNASNSSVTQEEVRGDIDTYMQLDAGVAILLFVLMCIYFPSSPPHPPSPSSAVQRTDFRSGIKALLINRDVLCLTFAYSISQGVVGIWLAVMVNNFRPLGISDKHIGYMGLASVLGQCVLSMVLAYLTDRIKNYMKPTLLFLLTLSTGGFIWLLLICSEIVPHSITILFIVVVLATSLNYSCTPLFFEMCVEIAYPVNEGVVGGFMTTANNLMGLAFLFIFFIPNIGFIWIDYVLVGATLLAIPGVLLTRESHNRSNVDQGTTS